MRIDSVDLEIQREPFARPFGFKGSAFCEKWNLVVRLRDAAGNEAFGVGGLAVLWSDEDVFSAHTETGGNVLQAAMLEHALQLAKGQDFADPPALLDALSPEVHGYGKRATENPALRPTFTLNALVALDNAAWMLFAKQQRIDSFDQLIPAAYRPVLSARQERLGLVPTISYTMPIEEVRSLLEQGAFVLKIKLGQAGDEQERLAKDQDWFGKIHEVARTFATSMTDSGNVLYYLDINGRYARKDTLLRLLDYAERHGMGERILLVEEPFSQVLRIDVHDVPARLAADESLHSVADLQTKVEQGYTAVALKPAGKTLSVAFRMAAAAAEAGVPAYLADNACVPLLVEWNKNVAARLPAFPGVKCGIMESNGPETYATWQRMLDALPFAGASWLRAREGAFALDGAYYQQSGGIFLKPTPYCDLFR